MSKELWELYREANLPPAIESQIRQEYKDMVIWILILGGLVGLLIGLSINISIG